MRIDSGLVSGKIDSHAVSSYLGIPFAAPPVGNLRWRPPQPVPKLERVRPTDDFGASCMQDEMGVRLPWSRGFMTQGPISENCLYLNVWTTSPDSSKKMPVMVWIYGGGYSEGSSQLPLQRRKSSAERRGRCYVQLSCWPTWFPRLPRTDRRIAAPLLRKLRARSDQIAALNWVHRNIAAFGGDPSNVTIFGQSAGAGSIGILMTSPLAKGLFEHAITESGLGLFRGLDLKAAA